MTGDAGDDFAQETQQNASQLLSFLMYRAGIKGASGSSVFGDNGQGAGRLSEWLSSAFNINLPERAELSESMAAKQPYPDTNKAAAKGLMDKPDEVEILVDTESDFEFIQGILEENNVEYSLSHETAPDGVFSLNAKDYSQGANIAVFKLPNRDILPKAAIHAPFSQTDHVLVAADHPYTQLKDLNPEIMGLFDFFSREVMIEKWALRGAIDDITKEGLLAQALGISEDPAMLASTFTAGAKQNVIADFTTVKWDPHANIIADPLKRMGVPFEVTFENDIAHFEISQKHVPGFKAVADFHLHNEASRVSLDRFPNYDMLEQASNTLGGKTELIEVSVADRGAATLLKNEFVERGVAFESLTSHTTGESTFLVSQAELAAKAPELAAAQEEFAAGTRRPTKASKRHVQQQEAEKALGNTVQKPDSTSMRDTGVSAHRKPTPARDERAATRSAQTRNLVQSKKLSQTAKRLPKKGNLS